MSDLMMRVLRGEESERRPLWIMRQAGRYLPEYRDLRKKYSFEELSRNPELAAEVTMMPIERFPLDAAIVFADLMSPVSALGIDVRFDPGPVIQTPISCRKDLESLGSPEAGRIAPEVTETLRRVKQELDGRAALLGFAGAPWSIAAYLVQGRGVTGFPALRAMAHADPELLNDLLARLADMSALYLVDQIEAGADAVQIFDTWAGLLSRRNWRRWVRPHLVRILDEVGRTGAPLIVFLQGAPHLVEEMKDLPAEAFSFDWRVDLPDVRRALGPRAIIQGNLDPSILLGGPEVTRRCTAALLEAMPPKGHIINLGHGITPEAPIESVEALIRTVHEEKRP